MGIDSERALAKVLEMLALVEESRRIVSTDSERYYSEEHRQLSGRIRELLPVVRRIAQAVEPSLSNEFVELPRRWEWTSVYNGLQRLKGLLEHEQELSEILGARGPQVPAERLHDWVWAPASSLWDDGHRREAIHAAATQIEVHAKAKLGRTDLSGSDLMLQAWALEPPRKSPTPRFRFPDAQPETDEYRSAHEGAKFLGAGCMLGIRNITTHSLEQPDEQIALEYLAALSVLARWIDAATVVIQEPAVT